MELETLGDESTGNRAKFVRKETQAERAAWNVLDNERAEQKAKDKQQVMPKDKFETLLDQE